MNLLVVGGTGLVGTAIAQELEGAGAEVVTLSRTGAGTSGRALTGDVTRPGLGLDSEAHRWLRGWVTHVVSCFGSVEWAATPRTAVEVHRDGTAAVLAFAAGCSSLQRVVHVSSVLAFGRARGTVGNRELYVGQRFRNWYEYGKYLAETAVRARPEVPTTVVRLGPILGVVPGVPASARHGLLTAVPYLARGYPAHLRHGGQFPCYVGDASTAAAVIAAALQAEGGNATWTWYDPTLPSLADVLIASCRPWGMPRLIDAPIFARLAPLLARRQGLPPELLAYAEPWLDIDPAVLDDLPSDFRCPAGYLEATGRALHDGGSVAALGGSFA